MNLSKKKELIARTFNVGRDRIVLNTERLQDLKDAITKQDMKDLLKDKAITVKEIKGRRKLKKRKTRRRVGSRKKNIKDRKQEYMTLARKLRSYLFRLRKKNQIEREDYIKLRQEIKANSFRSLAQFKQRLSK